MQSGKAESYQGKLANLNCCLQCVVFCNEMRHWPRIHAIDGNKHTPDLTGKETPIPKTSDNCYMRIHVRAIGCRGNEAATTVVAGSKAFWGAAKAGRVFYHSICNTIIIAYSTIH